MVDRRLLRIVPVLPVLVVVAVGLVFIATTHWLRGSAVLGAAALLGAVLRLVVPERFIGALRVRSRTFDVLFYVALAVLFALTTTVGI